jgi:hypothetical protein
MPFCGRCKFDLRYGTVGRPTAGHCAYCDNYGNFSEEHIYPNWLSKVYPRRSSRRLHIVERPEIIRPGSASFHKSEEGSGGDPYTATVRYVCETCNNQWMSDLQRDAKPIVQALASGRLPWNLADADWHTFARWAAMTAVSLEYHGRKPLTSKEAREMIMVGDAPPGLLVGTARMVSAYAAGTHWCNGSGVGVDGDDMPPSLITSSFWIIERAVFYVLLTPSDALRDVFYKEILRPLPVAIAWPDRRAGHMRDLTLEDLDGIQTRFGAGDPPQRPRHS